MRDLYVYFNEAQDRLQAVKGKNGRLPFPGGRDAVILKPDL